LHQSPLVFVIIVMKFNPFSPENFGRLRTHKTAEHDEGGTPRTFGRSYRLAQIVVKQATWETWRAHPSLFSLIGSDELAETVSPKAWFSWYRSFRLALRFVNSGTAIRTQTP